MNTVVVIASALLQLCTEMLQLSYLFCHTESVMCNECSWVCGSSVASVKISEEFSGELTDGDFLLS